MKPLLFIKDLTGKLILSLRRFPDTIALAVATVVVMIYLNHSTGIMEQEQRELLTRIAMILALGIPLSLCITLFLERLSRPSKWFILTIYTAAIGSLVLYYCYLLPDFKMVATTRYLALSSALYLGFIIIPYCYRKPYFENYLVNLVLRFLTTYLYSAVLYLGIAAMLFTIHKLFGAEINFKVYTDIWLVVAGIFAPTFFLAELPKSGREFETAGYPKVLRVLLLYIMMPIILAYTVILYLYFAKIILTWQWPNGIVANLVLWYSLITTAVIFATYPLRESNRWANQFGRVMPKLILPLLLMMFMAMGIRIKAYGFTENRYFVVLAGVWVTGTMIYLSLVKQARNILLPLSAALILILAVSGPLSSYSVSKYSQNLRFEKLLKQYGILQADRTIKAVPNLPSATQKELSTIISYFQEYHQLRNLKYLPAGFKVSQMPKVLGFKYQPSDLGSRSGQSYFGHQLNPEESIWDIKGFDYFATFSSNDLRNKQLTSGPVKIKFNPQTRWLQITKNGSLIYSRDLTAVALRVHQKIGLENTAKFSVMSYSDHNQAIQLLLVFKNFNGSEDKSSGAVIINFMEFDLFIKLLS